MSWTRMRRTVAPTAKPITLLDLGAWLRIDLPDEDTLLDQLVQSAVDYIEGPNGIGIALMPQTWELHLDGFPPCIEIPLTPVQSISSITYTDPDGNSQTLVDYQADIYSQPARIVPAYGGCWPATRSVMNAVTVTFTAGFNTVPGDLKRALALLAGHWFENRTASAEQLHEIPFGVEHILNKYRVGRIV